MAIRALTFDLDDTLWPVGPVITRAESDTQAFLERHYPAVAATFGFEQMRDLRFEIRDANPEIAHDMTEVRARSLIHAFAESGQPKTGAIEVMTVFMKARNAVDPFHDTHTGLARLAKHFPLIAVSNGNADVHQTPIGHYFAGAVSAAEAGCAKPDPRIFNLALEQLSLQPHEVLHIGDHPEQDVLGAMDAGLKAMWLTREKNDWPHDRRPDHTARDLTQAADLLLNSSAEPSVNG